MTTKARTPRTANEVLEKRNSGFLGVRTVDGGCRHRRTLKQALRDAEKAKDAWGERFVIYDCETKEKVYTFSFLGSDR